MCFCVWIWPICLEIDSIKKIVVLSKFKILSQKLDRKQISFPSLLAKLLCTYLLLFVFFSIIFVHTYFLLLVYVIFPFKVRRFFKLAFLLYYFVVFMFALFVTFSFLFFLLFKWLKIYTVLVLYLIHLISVKINVVENVFFC